MKSELERRLHNSAIFAGLHGRGLELAIHIRWSEAPNLMPRSLLERLRERGVFATVSAGDHALMLMPPLTITEDELAAAIDIVSSALME